MNNAVANAADHHAGGGHIFDALILGSGLGALVVALHLPAHWRIAILTKRHAADSASSWAQGGIAAVQANDDSLSNHLHDTVTAGAGLCEKAAVQFVVEGAPAAIAWLQAVGVRFSEENGQLHLTREGGHSHRRIAHAADSTGEAIMQTLLANLAQKRNVQLLEEHMLVDLITTHKLGQGLQAAPRCVGLYALNESTQEVETFVASYTILATGGAGKVYLYTTNPDTATGDGIAAAWRAGCRVANMEFVQFHPTCLYHPKVKSFLISEAVRGEGGVLHLPPETGSDNARRFMAAYDAKAELAPRDVVARAIDFELKKHGLDCVHLDISHQSPTFLQTHFPTILQRCLALGIDITRDPIPVVPAAHYTCGGVMVDLHGQTDIAGLYAVGEVSYSGLHGANRLASNSLLECVVLGKAVALHMQTDTSPIPPSLPHWDASRVSDADEIVVISHNWDELRRLMWNYVGIVRTDKRLERAAHRIDLLKAEIEEFYAHFHVSRDLLELRNLVLVADLIVRSAKMRKESRGLHFNRDYPDTLPDAHAHPTVLNGPEDCL